MLRGLTGVRDFPRDTIFAILFSGSSEQDAGYQSKIPDLPLEPLSWME